MLELKRKRPMGELEKTDRGLRNRAAKDLGAVERRIGRWMGKYAAAEKLVNVSIRRDHAQRAIGLEITEVEDRKTWTQQAHGAYLLRTNCPEKSPAQLWRWYSQLTQAEDAFRISKDDLKLRPVFHQKTERVEAHILICFLSLALWRALEMRMKGKQLGDCVRQLVKAVATVTSMDVVLPTKEENQITLRVVARPDRPVAELLTRLGLELPSAPMSVQNVVEKKTS